MAEDNEEARRRRAEQDARHADDSSNDEPPKDANAAHQASQNEYAEIDDSKVPEEDEYLSRDDDERQDDNDKNDNGKNRDHWTPENGTEFNDEDAKYTTLSPNYSEEDQELDSLFNPIDDELRDLHGFIQDKHRALERLDTNSPDALSQMRDILLQDEKIESRIYNSLKLLETHSVDYQNVKDRLLPEDGKKMFQRLKPLFDISKKEQMDTFVKAFYNINSIEKKGYLKNLLDLATFFKEHQREILGDDKDDGSSDRGQDGTHDE